MSSGSKQFDRHRVLQMRAAVGIVLQERGHRRVDGHHGVHRGRMDGVDPDTMRRKRIGQRPHQPDDAVFGRRVPQPATLQSAETPQSGCRAGEDDRSAPFPGDQMRDRGLRGVERTDQIHVEDVGPHVRDLPRSVSSRNAIAAMPALASTMSSRPKCSTPASSAALTCIEIAHVGDRAEHLAARRLHQSDRLVELVAVGHRIAIRRDVGADVDADDVGAVGGEPHARGFAPARAPRR